MKIAVLSDTHIRWGRKIAGFIWENIADVDGIIHAGDIISQKFLDELSSLAPVTAVRGNCDSLDLPDKTIVQLDFLKVGVTHGYLGQGSTTPEKAFHSFGPGEADIIIFGHSHIPYQEYRQGVWLFNPGSPSERRGQPYFSFGLLTVEEKTFDLRHLFFS